MWFFLSLFLFFNLFPSSLLFYFYFLNECTILDLVKFFSKSINLFSNLMNFFSKWMKFSSIFVNFSIKFDELFQNHSIVSEIC